MTDSHSPADDLMARVRAVLDEAGAVPEDFATAEARSWLARRADFRARMRAERDRQLATLRDWAQEAALLLREQNGLPPNLRPGEDDPIAGAFDYIATCNHACDYDTNQLSEALDTFIRMSATGSEEA